ncbi:MAG: hypothetical protein HY821_24250 [Acidobacteria bacterium]|nr:hypothetical protein [Acidobacteriota bacterium]
MAVHPGAPSAGRPAKRLCSALLFIAIIQPILPWANAQALPPRLRSALRDHMGAKEHQLKTVEGGGIVTYSVDTGVADEIMLVGVARIWATPSAFVSHYREIIKFESGPGILAQRKFSVPPVESDLAGLNLSREEADEIRKCRPGKCAFKIGAPGMKFLQSAVNWNSSDYVHQATQAVHTLWLQYLVRYQNTGDKGLAVYHDSEQQFSVGQGLQELVSRSSALQEYAPQLATYLRDYPASKSASTEEFFYWQVGAFGLKPVHRVTHVAIQKTPAAWGEAYVIADKMLFASHYFRSALELQYLIPGQDQNVGGMHYLVSVQRSYVDGITGFRGRMMRTIAVRKAREAMKRHIASVKATVERDFNRASTQSQKPPTSR